MKTMFKCAACGRITAGRISREGNHNGDTSHRFPRRHKVNGSPCGGNVIEAIWIDVDTNKEYKN